MLRRQVQLRGEAEMDFGPFEGQRPADLRTGPLANEFAAWRRQDHPVVPETAESYAAAATRAQAIFDSLRPEHETTVLVTHGYLARLLLVQCILGMPPAHLRRLRLDNGRFAIVAWEGQTPRLVALNTPNLDEVLR
ncbi:MAG: histidine phosphatase family protein [bacterium]|nr:histidine phosphatase family protein [bacterium]